MDASAACLRHLHHKNTTRIVHLFKKRIRIEIEEQHIMLCPEPSCLVALRQRVVYLQYRPGVDETVWDFCEICRDVFVEGTAYVGREAFDSCGRRFDLLAAFPKPQRVSMFRRCWENCSGFGTVEVMEYPKRGEPPSLFLKRYCRSVCSGSENFGDLKSIWRIDVATRRSQTCKRDIRRGKMRAGKMRAGKPEGSYGDGLVSLGNLKFLVFGTNVL